MGCGHARGAVRREGGWAGDGGILAAPIRAKSALSVVLISPSAQMLCQAHKS